MINSEMFPRRFGSYTGFWQIPDISHLDLKRIKKQKLYMISCPPWSEDETRKFLYIKDSVPLIEKRRGLSPGGRFPPSFIHQVIIITGLNKLQLYVLALKMTLDADRV